MLNLERLRVLLAVRNNESVAGAARALSVTPSGVSQQLGKLERETGHALTFRQGRSVQLTNAGVVLADRAERMIGDLREAERELADLHAEVLGPLRIGSLGSSIRLLVAPALGRLVTDHPRVRPSVLDGESVEHLPLLRSGHLDAIVGERWPDSPSKMHASIEFDTILREPVHVALAAGHPMADAAEVNLGELGEGSWVTCPGDTQDALVAALAGRHIEPRIDYQVAEFPTQVALVRAGLAVALLPSVTIGAVPDGVVTRPLRPSLTRHIYVAWRRDTDRPVIRAFAAAVRQVAQTLAT